MTSSHHAALIGHILLSVVESDSGSTRPSYLPVTAVARITKQGRPGITENAVMDLRALRVSKRAGDGSSAQRTACSSFDALDL